MRHTNSYTWVHRCRNIQIHTYIHPSPYLPASAGQAGVTPDLALEIVLALAVPAQIDSAGLHMDVHQVVHDAALNVVLDSVHQEPPADINHLDEGQLPAGQEPTRFPSDPPQILTDSPPRLDSLYSPPTKNSSKSTSGKRGKHPIRSLRSPIRFPINPHENPK